MSIEDDWRETLERIAREVFQGRAANAPTFDPLEMLTPDDVAKLFKLKPETVRAYCAGGDLPAHKLGNVWRLNRAELVAWVERHGLPEGVPSPANESERILRSLKKGA